MWNKTGNINPIKIIIKANSYLSLGFASAITDTDGMAILDIPKNSKGIITVLYDEKKVSITNQPSIPYETGETVDETQVFTITLADKVIEQLYNPQ